MRFLSFTLSLLIAASALAAGNNLVVRQKTGNTAIALSSISRITFPSSGGVTISLSDGSSQSFTHENLYSLKFNSSSTGIIEQIGLNTGNDAITFDGSLITTVMAESTGITVYSLDGTVVAAGISSQLDVTHLIPGVYIVKAGCLTAKIIK